MSLNSSSSNASFHSPTPSSSFNIYILLHSCMNSKVGVSSITILTIISVLFVLPLCVLVIYMGLQRWRQQHRSGTTTSHSDIFTYNMIITEVMNILGFIISCCGVLTSHTEVAMLGIYLCSLNFTAQIFFHVLTCVERYLAVVHPVTYLGLRQAKTIRIRNIVIGCLWLLCFAVTGFMSLADHVSITVVAFSSVVVSVIVVSFCSISVLCVLIRPGPGDRQRADQSKLRAFYTIMAILGVLVLRFGGNVVCTVLHDSLLLGKNEQCAVWLSEPWFCLPSSLVLPLLFLHRAGKLSCYKNKNTSGQGSD